MCAKWIKRYDPEHLAVRLDENKSLGQDGRVSFNGFGFTEYIVVLNSMVSLNNSITEFEKDNIVRQAAFSLGKRGKISSSGLLKEITKFEIPKGFDTMNYAKYAIIILGNHVKQVAAIGYIKRLGKVIQE